MSRLSFSPHFGSQIRFPAPRQDLQVVPSHSAQTHCVVPLQCQHTSTFPCSTSSSVGSMMRVVARIASNKFGATSTSIGLSRSIIRLQGSKPYKSLLKWSPKWSPGGHPRWSPRWSGTLRLRSATCAGDHLTTDHLHLGQSVAKSCHQFTRRRRARGRTQKPGQSRSDGGIAPVLRRVALSRHNRGTCRTLSFRANSGQLCAFLDRGRDCFHDDIAVTDGSFPVKGNILAAALGCYFSPVVLILPSRPHCELLGGFQEADAGVRRPHGSTSGDKGHCGLARRKLLFAVLNRDVLGH
jgi:hypothetical protein